MQDHVTVVYYEPAIAGLTLFAAFFLMLFAHSVQNRIGQRIEHAVAGAVADNKVVCEASDVFKIEQ